MGVIGTAGVWGCSGAAGCTGVLGIGVAGCTGALGIGVAGCTGALGIGVAGIRGVAGIPGATGARGVDGVLGVEGEDGPAGDPGCPVFELVAEPDWVPVPVCVAELEPVWVPDPVWVPEPVLVDVDDAVVVEVAVPPLLKLIELGSDMTSIPFVVETRFGRTAREDLGAGTALVAFGTALVTTCDFAGSAARGDRFCAIAIRLHMLWIDTRNRVSGQLKRQSP